MIIASIHMLHESETANYFQSPLYVFLDEVEYVVGGVNIRKIQQVFILVFLSFIHEFISFKLLVSLNVIQQVKNMLMCMSTLEKRGIRMFW